MYFKSICLNKFVFFSLSSSFSRKSVFVQCPLASCPRVHKIPGYFKNCQWISYTRFCSRFKGEYNKSTVPPEPPVELSRVLVYTGMCFAECFISLFAPPPALPESWGGWCAMGVGSHQTRKHNRIHVCGFGSSETI